MNFEEWLHCYTMTLTANCGGENGPAYRRCYLQNDCYGIDIQPGWYDCYWHGKCDVPNSSEIEEEEEVCTADMFAANLDHHNDFYRWLECHTGGVPACRDDGNKYQNCYLNNKCCGVVDLSWHDCYWHQKGCKPNPTDFETWLYCIAYSPNLTFE